MAWGMIMAVPTVVGMLMLIFAQPSEEYQTFGEIILNGPEPMAETPKEDGYRQVA
jgi:hypothetical protein